MGILALFPGSCSYRKKIHSVLFRLSTGMAFYEKSSSEGQG